MQLRPHPSPTTEDWESTEAIKPRRRHYVQAVVLLVLVVVTVITVRDAWPALDISVISLISDGASFATGDSTVGGALDFGATVAFVVMIFMLTRRKSGYQRLLNAALKEEKEYRAGAEHWTWGQRLVSCATFGLTHLWNLVIPLYVVVGLSLAGFYFMFVYLQTYGRTQLRGPALQEAAAVHAAYNVVLFRVVWPLLALGLIVFIVVAVVTAS
jgi:hypothetical protein